MRLMFYVKIAREKECKALVPSQHKPQMCNIEA